MTCQTTEKLETTRSEPEHTRSGQSFVPNVDIIEHDDKFLLVADVPGAKADGIDINYERGLLTVHARIEPRSVNGPARWLTREFGVGDFRRSFRIGEGIDASRIQAEVANGVLTLHLPKSEAAKVQKIEVKAAN